MKLSQINATAALKAILEPKVGSTVVYAESKPTSALPNDYILIRQNGQIRTKLSQMGYVEGILLVMINVKLASNGIRNTVKEDLILASFDDLFKDNASITHDNYTFKLTPDSMIYNGGGVHEGYSSKFINITFNKKQNG